MQVIGIIDVSREKEKGYGTIVKEGFCEEVRVLMLDNHVHTQQYILSFPSNLLDYLCILPSPKS